MIICGLCGCQLKSVKGLGTHIQHKHSPEPGRVEYYRLFLKKSDQEGKCGTCSSPTKFNNISTGFNEYCSSQCSAVSPDLRARTKATVSAFSDEKKASIISKRGDTKKEWYGDPKYNNIEKMKDTKFLVYGDRTFGNPEKGARTKLVKYGFAHFNQDQVRKTNLERYGVPAPLQNPEILRKSHEASHKYKDHTLPSGSLIRVRGYEPQAIDWLLGSYREDEIKTGQIPFVPYSHGGKQHRYFPDIWIPHLNRLYEVKSRWTLHTGLPVLRDKALAVLEAGYLFSIILVSKKGKKSSCIEIQFTGPEKFQVLEALCS